MPVNKPQIDTPGSIDLWALVITPAQTVPGIIAECGAKGIRNAIVYSSGFEEVESGKVVAQQLADAWLIDYNEHRPHDAL